MKTYVCPEWKIFMTDVEVTYCFTQTTYNQLINTLDYVVQKCVKPGYYVAEEIIMCNNGRKIDEVRIDKEGLYIQICLFVWDSARLVNAVEMIKKDLPEELIPFVEKWLDSFNSMVDRKV